jgi:hypothetical protein
LSAFSAGAFGDSQSESSRTKKVTGATLVGMTRRRGAGSPSAVASASVAGCGDRRPHPTAPVKHSRSRTAGS